MLTALAAVAAQVSTRRLTVGTVRPVHVQEFTLAGIARTCLAASNEYRHGTLTERLLNELCHDYINISDPNIEAGTASLDEIMRPIIYEQFLVQYSPKENLARSYALYVSHMAGLPNAPSQADWVDVLGVDVARYLRIGFGLHAAFMQNRGTITWTTLGAKHVAPLWRPLAIHEFRALVERQLASPIDEAAERARNAEAPGREKWSFNPLQDRPIVLVGDEELVCPAPHFLLDKISAAGLYYTGLDLFGSRFTDALGIAYERYVGTQLGLLSGATLYPEIHYDKGQRKSCDYIVVMDEVVLLVEVKVTRPLIAYRTGGDPEPTLARMRSARDQIVETARLIRERDPAFAHIPADIPRLGLIATLEPYFLTQSTLEHGTLTSSELTITSAWAHEVENVMAYLAVQPSPASLLLRHWQANAAGSDEPITAIIGSDEPARNPIVDAAFDAALDLSELGPDWQED